VAGYNVRVPLADGFDLPVGKPDARGYYVFRGFYPNGHLGEDWNGNGGGDSDLGDPVYAMGDGVVVFSEDYKRRWGNVVIIRHAFREADGRIAMVDSLYGHLDRRTAKLYQVVKKGQQIGTIGNCYGIYAAHLHFEVRKNLRIGMARSSYARDYSNYYSPRQFIASRRILNSRGDTALVPADTFGGSSDDERDPDTDKPPVVAAAKTLPPRQSSKVTTE
jgi:murein DD-endopeptidase MepM/ murein hydrolase activator NlpD